MNYHTKYNNPDIKDKDYKTSNYMMPTRNTL